MENPRNIYRKSMDGAPGPGPLAPGPWSLGPGSLGPPTLRECPNRAVTVQKNRADTKHAKNRPQKRRTENTKEKLEKS